MLPSMREVNRAVGGAKNSVHVLGYAADLKPAGMTLDEAMRLVAESGLHFDQAILEFGRWLHLGWKGPHGEQRRELLRIDRPGNYEPWRS